MRAITPRLAAAATRFARGLHLDQRGAGVIWFATFTLVCLLGGAIVIDYGDITVERRDLQKSADAIVMAGVQELPEETLLADQFAREWGLRNGVAPAEIVNLTVDNSCWSEHPDDDPLVIDSISADISRPANLFLLREFGLSIDVGAHAKGCVGSLTEAEGLRPWSISIFNSECFALKTGGDPTKVLDYEPLYGQRCVIRLESPSSQVGSIRLGDTPGDECSPSGGGASAYTENIVEGSDATCSIGEIIATEPGLQVVPTFQAVQDMLALEGACDAQPWGDGDTIDQLLEVFTTDPADLVPGPDTIFIPRNCGWDTDPGTPDTSRFVSLVLIDEFDSPTGFDDEPIIAFAGFFVEGCEVVEDDGSLTPYPECDMSGGDRANAQIVGTFVQYLRLGGPAGVLNPFGSRTYVLVE